MGLPRLQPTKLCISDGPEIVLLGLYLRSSLYTYLGTLVVAARAILWPRGITIFTSDQKHFELHYIDFIRTTMASQITSLTIVYSTVYSDQRKHQSSASLAFVWGIHRDRWIPRTKGQLRGKCFHLMTSTWWAHKPFIKWVREHSFESVVLIEHSKILLIVKL